MIYSRQSDIRDKKSTGKSQKKAFSGAFYGLKRAAQIGIGKQDFASLRESHAFYKGIRTEAV